MGKYKDDINEISYCPLFYNSDCGSGVVLENNRGSFVETLQEKFNEIISDGYTSRTAKKEKLTHDILKEALCSKLPDDYYIISKTEEINSKSTNGEYKTKYLATSKKSIDITIKDEYGNAVCFINCKFPMQSVGKNGNNLLEEIGGEMMYLNDKNKDIPFFSFNIIPSETPVWNSDGICTIENNTNTIEKLDDATRICKSFGFVKEIFLGVFDDNKMKCCGGKNLDFFKKEHKSGYVLSLTKSEYKCNHLIYNDFDKFVNSIIDCVYEHDKHKKKNIFQNG